MGIVEADDDFECPTREEMLRWARGTISRYEEIYRVEKNPVFAWRAWGIWRSLAYVDPPPIWVLQYFDRVQANLSWLAGERPSKRKIAPGIVAALGFVPGGVELTTARNLACTYDDRDRLLGFHEKPAGYNPFSDRSLKPPHREIAYAVAKLLETGNSKKERTAAVREVAKRFLIDERTVQRALKKYPIPL